MIINHTEGVSFEAQEAQANELVELLKKASIIYSDLPDWISDEFDGITNASELDYYGRSTLIDFLKTHINRANKK